MRVDEAARQQLADGFAGIRRRFGVPDGFPVDVREAALAAVRRGPLPADRADLTELPFVTLDPLGSMDLDQAFHLEADGDEVLLRYAIADVGAWVEPGDRVDAEAWSRGSTVYAPDRRASLYPPELSEGAASLLPDGERPAVVLTVAVSPDGTPSLRSAARAFVRSRARLAYETVHEAELSPLVMELSARIERAEEARGADRIDFPEPEVDVDPSSPAGVVLRARPRRWSEDTNAGLSLAANLAVAQTMLAAGVGLFRVMDEPDRRAVRRLRREATAFGVDWPRDTGLRALRGRLDPGEPRHAAFLRAARRAGGDAGYRALLPGQGGSDLPWHSVIAAPYAHATAPLRRLADRCVLDLVVAVSSGLAPPAHVLGALPSLPDVMDRAESVAGQVDRAVVDLVEAVLLAPHVGETFPATIVDLDERGARVQLADPPVRIRLRADGAGTGDALDVRVVAVDVAAARIAAEVVPGHRQPPAT